MKKLFAVLSVLMLLSCSFSIADESLSFSPHPWPCAGDTELVLDISGRTGGMLQANAFAAGAAIAVTGDILEDGSLRLTLARPLTEGEEITVILMEDDVQVSRVYSVKPAHGAKLSDLRTGVDDMRRVMDEWVDAYRGGQVIIPMFFADLPFIVYPDEAPQIRVTESDDQAAVYLSEPVPEGWTVLLSEGIPVTQRPCEWDEARACFTGTGSFDSVCLYNDGGDSGISITVTYKRDNGFIADYPVIEWVEPGAEDPIGIACYGFGTARSFEGGIWAIVGPNGAFYAEYNSERVLETYWNLITECDYDRFGNLISGEEPDGYVNPVTIQ